MKRLSLLSALFLVLTVQVVWGQIPQTMSYQGVLTDGSGDPISDGSHNLTFKLYDAASDGTALWTETQSVNTSNGLFNVILGSTTPLNLAFNKPYWLGITVGAGSELSPRIELTSSAYSLNARGVLGSSNVFPYDGNVGIGTTSPNSMLEVAGTTHSTSGGFKFPDGTTQTTAATTGPAGWSLTGNSGTVDGTNFLGTTDNVALNLWVNNARAFRIEPTENSPNIIGGFSDNKIESGVYGSTIGGGGRLGGRANKIFDKYCTVSGGLDNSAGNDDGSIDYEFYAATVGGGSGNNAKGTFSTISGGSGNRTEGSYSFIGGGNVNLANGNYATIPGGLQNYAHGSCSFAAGYHAEALHNYCFVWSDNLGGTSFFKSTGDSQFLIHASGGVGINTNSPSEMLSVAGIIESTSGGFKFPDGTTQTTAATGGGTDGDWTISGNDMYSAVSGNVGIGTSSPQRKLHIAKPDNVSLVLEDTGAPADQKKKFINTDDGKLNLGKFSDAWAFTPQMTIANNGNVGIGKTDPSAPLEIYSNSLSVPKFAVGDLYGWHFEINADGKAGVLYGDATKPSYAFRSDWDTGMFRATYNTLGFSTSGNERVRISPEGNVGIGTNDPQGTLDVNGSIYQRGSELHADYVFESDYTLESIEEHADFMWKNKHLKAIPKATVDENGCEIVEVGAHRKGIVEELEKAHIYINQLNGRIKALEEIVGRLTASVPDE